MPRPIPQRRPVDLALLDGRAARMKLRRRRGLARRRKENRVAAARLLRPGPPRRRRQPCFHLRTPVSTPRADRPGRPRILARASPSPGRHGRRHFHDPQRADSPLWRRDRSPSAARACFRRRGSDPSNVADTLEQNEHVAFEVYARAVQETDDSSPSGANWKKHCTKASFWLSGSRLLSFEKRKVGVSRIMLHVALWEPEIPPNTGNVARLAPRPGPCCT